MNWRKRCLYSERQISPGDAILILRKILENLWHPYTKFYHHRLVIFSSAIELSLSINCVYTVNFFQQFLSVEPYFRSHERLFECSRWKIILVTENALRDAPFKVKGNFNFLLFSFVQSIR
jgi:hypothetical protein